MSKLIKCKNCGGFIAKNTDSCPSCGAKVNRTSVLTWIAVIVIGLIVLSAVRAVTSDEVPDSNTASDEQVSSIDQAAVPSSTDDTDAEVLSEPEVITSNWKYSESVDEMRGTTTYTAITTSRNNVHLSSPYTGGTDLSIVVRHSNDLGNEVLILTDNGQLWCEYRNCIMTVKFDDKNIEEYPVSRAAGGSSEAMFLDNSEDAFINKLKESKVTMLEIGFYNNGNQQFTFDTADLDWQH